jgi:hypothetical protein
MCDFADACERIAEAVIKKNKEEEERQERIRERQQQDKPNSSGISMDMHGNIIHDEEDDDEVPF